MPISTVPNGPDFLCIGMQKAGTGWLYDQLQYHPDFYMPPVKELHYFDREFPAKNLAKTLSLYENSMEELERKRQRASLRPLEPRDHRFFEDAKGVPAAAIDMPFYGSLFRHKEDLLSGDITPAYSTLQDEVIHRIAEYLPDIKIVLLLRDPVARVWSQISMKDRRSSLDREILEDGEKLGNYLEDEKISGRSFATETFKRWSRHVPDERFRYFFLDDIEKHPEETRRNVLSFLGADPDKSSGSLEPQFNRKSSKAKLEMSEAARNVLVEHFADEIRACAAVFGGPAANWVERYRL